MPHSKRKRKRYYAKKRRNKMTRDIYYQTFIENYLSDNNIEPEYSGPFANLGDFIYKNQIPNEILIELNIPTKKKPTIRKINFQKYPNTEIDCEMAIFIALTQSNKSFVDWQSILSCNKALWTLRHLSDYFSIKRCVKFTCQRLILNKVIIPTDWWRIRHIGNDKTENDFDIDKYKSQMKQRKISNRKKSRRELSSSNNLHIKTTLDFFNAVSQSGFSP